MTTAVARGANLVVVDADRLALSYEQFDCVVVHAVDLDGAQVTAWVGPEWADAELDDAEPDVGRELIAWLDPSETVEVRGIHVVLPDGARPAAIANVPDPAALRAELDAARARHACALALEGAVAGPLTPAIEAPEMLRLACWSRSLCDAVIELAEATGAWGSDPDDPVPGDEVSLMTLSPDLFRAVERHLDEVIVPALRIEWPEFAWCGLHDVFLIRYEATPVAPSAELHLHHDVAQISAAMRLNDGFDGGALEFPRQSWDNSHMPVGELIAWPSLVTHPHRGAPVTRGTKYSLTMWFALPV